jgi:nucleoside-diphosphate-sugar epimerase
LVDDQAVTQNELAEKYQAMTGEHLRRVHIPRSIVYAIGFVVQSAFALLRRPAPLSVYRLRSALAPRTFDCTRARNALQWQPQRGVDRGLRDAVAVATDQNGQLWNARHLPDVVSGDFEMLNR